MHRKVTERKNMKDVHDKPLEHAGISTDASRSDPGGALPFFPAGRADPLAGWGKPPRRYGWLIVTSSLIAVAAGGFFSIRFLARADAEPALPDVPRPVGYRVHHDSDSPDPRVVIEVAGKGPPRREDPPADAVVGFLESLPPVKDAAALREGEIREAVNQLRLQAIMAGTNPTASINGQAVTVDSVINVPAGTRHGAIAFRVVAISDQAVSLDAEGVEIELRLPTARTH